MSDTSTLPAASTRSSTLVLAVGSPFRQDDGLGGAALALLAQYGLPAGVTLLDAGTPGLETALLIQGWDRVAIIDAAELGERPGAWRRIDASGMVPSGDPPVIGIHDAGLKDALALADALGLLPLHTVIYAMQPEVTGWGSGLSQPVTDALPALCQGILTDLASLANG